MIGRRAATDARRRSILALAACAAVALLTTPIVDAKWLAPEGRAILEVVAPELDQAALRLTIRARNRGGVDLQASPITVHYRVDGVARGPAETVAAGTFQAPGVAMPRGATVDVGTVTLSDRRRAYSFEHLTIGVRLEVVGRPAVEPAAGSFPHRWKLRTALVSADALHDLASSLNVAIRLNNFDARSAAVARNDSSVSVSVGEARAHRQLDLPPSIGRLPGPGGERPVAVLLDSLEGEGRGVRIRGDELVVPFVLAPGRGPGLRFGLWRSGSFDDGAIADAPLGPLAGELALILGATPDGARLTAVRGSVRVTPRPARLPPDLAALEPVSREMIDRAVRLLDSLVLEIVRDPGVGRALERALSGALPPGVTFIHRIDGRGDAWTVSYL